MINHSCNEMHPICGYIIFNMLHSQQDEKKYFMQVWSDAIAEAYSLQPNLKPGA